jgi:hypothetical protein
MHVDFTARQHLSLEWSSPLQFAILSLVDTECIILQHFKFSRLLEQRLLKQIQTFEFEPRRILHRFTTKHGPCK